MAQFPGLTFTKTGYEMITRAASGLTDDQLIITKAKLGSGVFNGDIRSLTDLVAPKLDVSLSTYKSLGNGQIEYTFVYDNKSIFAGFPHREVGIYAKNGDAGIEKLIAYSNAGDNYSYISDVSKPIPIQTMKVVLSIGDTQNISAVVNVANAVTEERLAYVMGEHNNATGAHSAMTSTINDALTPTSNTASLRILLSNVAAMIKANKGTSTWRDTPPTTLTALAQFMAQMPTGDGIEWNGKKWKNKLTGMSGLNDQNGYISFGPAAAGTIIQWGKGVFESAGTVSIPLPLACNKVLVAVAIDDTTDIEAGTIGWVTSQTNNNMISFGCAKQISVFVYLAICI